MSLTPEQRDRIVQTSLSWLRTPYRPHARIKAAGVDCATLLLCVYHEAGVIPDFDPGFYHTQIHKHREDTQYLDMVRQFAVETPEDQAQPGDVVIFKIGHGFGHSAIILDWPDRIVHAVHPHGVIVSAAWEGFLKRRKRMFFTVK